MTKLNRQDAIAEALNLLDEVGLDNVTTRQLAKRLRVEQPSLYWHFQSKAELLAAMADAAMAPHATAPLPLPFDDWRIWFAENMRSFRRTLLLRRDGARLHAGTRPGALDRERIARKMAFLIACGLSEKDASMAMLAAGRFTVGSVLEEQAESSLRADPDPAKNMMLIDQEAAFEAGLALIIDGLSQLQKHR
jgi:TetR/AcrR family tetracycline transcriptional repressor